MCVGGAYCSLWAAVCGSRSPEPARSYGKIEFYHPGRLKEREEEQKRLEADVQDGHKPLGRKLLRCQSRFGAVNTFR